MISFFKNFFFFILIYLSLTLRIYAIETKADSAIILDVNSNTILFEKNADERQGPASMSKLMLIYIVFERLQNKTLTIEQEFLVSKKAWKFGGSKMFVNIGEMVSVENLLKGIIIAGRSFMIIDSRIDRKLFNVSVIKITNFFHACGVQKSVDNI